MHMMYYGQPLRILKINSVCESRRSSLVICCHGQSWARPVSGAVFCTCLWILLLIPTLANPILVKQMDICLPKLDNAQATLLQLEVSEQCVQTLFTQELCKLIHQLRLFKYFLHVLHVSLPHITIGGVFVRSRLIGAGSCCWALGSINRMMMKQSEAVHAGKYQEYGVLCCVEPCTDFSTGCSMLLSLQSHTCYMYY